MGERDVAEAWVDVSEGESRDVDTAASLAPTVHHHLEYCYRMETRWKTLR